MRAASGEVVSPGTPEDSRGTLLGAGGSGKMEREKSLRADADSGLLVTKEAVSVFLDRVVGRGTN